MLSGPGRGQSVVLGKRLCGIVISLVWNRTCGSSTHFAGLDRNRTRSSRRMERWATAVGKRAAGYNSLGSKSVLEQQLAGLFIREKSEWKQARWGKQWLFKRRGQLRAVRRVLRGARK